MISYGLKLQLMETVSALTKVPLNVIADVDVPIAIIPFPELEAVQIGA